MQIQTLSLSNLRLSESNVRKTFNEAEINELAQSIASVGLLSPLVVEHDPLDDTYEIVAGHRRYLALVKNGATEAPCTIVKHESSTDVLVTMLIENCQRVDITPVQEARAYQKLREAGRKQTDIAKTIGKSQGHISRRLALMKLPDYVLNALDEGTLSLDMAHRLTGLDPIHVAALKNKIGKLTGWDIDQAEGKQRRAKEMAAIDKFLEGRTDVVETRPNTAKLVKSYNGTNIHEAMISDTMVLHRSGAYVHVYDTSKPQHDWVSANAIDDDEDDSPTTNWWDEYNAAFQKYREERDAWIDFAIKNPTPLAQLAAVAMRYQLLDCWYDEVCKAAGIDSDEPSDDQLLSYLRQGNNTLRLWTKHHLDGSEIEEMLTNAGIIRPERSTFQNAEAIDPIEEDPHDDLGYEVYDEEVA